jgi:hypothetical protein
MSIFALLAPGMILFGLIILAGAVLLAVFYLLNLQNLLKEVSPENRLAPPANVWLLIIPIFGTFYGYWIYPRISDSVKKEYESLGLPPQGDFCKALGYVMPSLAIVGYVFDNYSFSSLISLASLVIWIVYWVKTASYRNTLRYADKSHIARSISSNPDLLD